MAAPSRSRPSLRAPVHRLRPVVWGSVAVLVTYAGFQALVAWSATTTLWWQNQWLLRNLHARYPRASFGPPQPVPSWESWLPASASAVALIGALVAVALALVCAGRGWWLLLPAALPLIPAQISPGAWAPQLSNQAVYAIVWPAGSTQPSIAWPWLSAAVEALVVALPAVALSAVVLHRRPALFSAEVLRRLLLVVLAIGAVAVWNSSAGEPQDWVMLARRATWVVIGGLLLSGGLRRRWAVPLVLALPAAASGVVRWTTGLDGHPVITFDSSAWALSVAALLGGAWVFAAPWAALPLRWWHAQWDSMVAADVARRTSSAGISAGSDEPGEEAESPTTAEPVGSVSHRAPAAPAGAGGRHRA